MLDVTNAPEAAKENRGVNEKLWIDVDGRIALFKKTQVRQSTGEHTNAHSAEAFVSDMCNLLGYNCAKVDVAKRNGEIGCISYNFLKDGEQLIDLNALIQNIRISFNSKSMEVKDTGEKYSIPLILEAIEEECSTDEEYYNARKDFFKGCLIDSIIEHYDRNSSNIAIIKDSKGIRLSPMFDNGTSLGVAVPKAVMHEKLQRDNWIEQDREVLKSKIGIEGERCSSYDKVEEFILSNYYGDVREFLLSIKEKLTPENIAEILQSNKYEDLDNIYKKSISMKIQNNSRVLLERAQKYELKYLLEQYMSGKETAKELRELANQGELQRILPEIQDCIGCPQRNKYHIYDVDEYMFRCIENINNIEEIAKKYGIELPKLFDQDKNTIKWAIMLNEMGKPEAREEILEEGNIRDQFKNYTENSRAKANSIMERLNFYPKNREQILALISTHRRLDFNSESSIKRLISEVGEDNINLFITMKLAEYEARSPETKDKSINELKQLQEQINKILSNDSKGIIKSLPLNGKKMMKQGVFGKNIGVVQERLVEYVKQDESMYRYYKARGHLEKYRSQLIEQTQIEAKEVKRQIKLENARKVAETVNAEEKQKAKEALSQLKEKDIREKETKGGEEIE